MKKAVLHFSSRFIFNSTHDSLQICVGSDVGAIQIPTYSSGVP